MRDEDEVRLDNETSTPGFKIGQTVYWNRPDGTSVLCLISGIGTSDFGAYLYELRQYRFGSDGTPSGFNNAIAYAYASELETSYYPDLELDT